MITSLQSLVVCLNPILAGTGFCPENSVSTETIKSSLNPILAGTGFCRAVGMVYVIATYTSQSYSCWYWVLSPDDYTSAESGSMSQSYSCWYWVLSLFNSFLL